MATEFKLPELGENIEGGDVTRLLVAVGDEVTEDQPVLEIETGKATLEVPSTVAGKIVSIAVSAGDKATVGQTILTVDATDGGAAAQAPKEPAAEESAPPPSPPEPEPEAPPPPPPPPPKSPSAEPELAAAAAALAGSPVAAAAASPGVPVPAAPSVRKFAREIGIDIAAVPGTGAKARISMADVKAYAKKLNEGRPGGGPAAVAPPLPDFEKWGEIQRDPMSNVRKATLQHMSVCWSTIPHVTQHDRADITELEAFRKRFSAKAEASGGKLSPTAILLKIVASALKVFPQFNASIDTEKSEIIYKKYIHVGVAVDTPKGLVVPVLRDVDKKNIIELARELSDIATRMREGKIAPSDMQGGTFTISNLGGIGGTYFTPIVNHPEVAILGIGRASMEPVYADGEFRPRMMLPLSLSYDHRLIDGADGARFLRWIADAIYEPLLLPLEG